MSDNLKNDLFSAALNIRIDDDVSIKKNYLHIWEVQKVWWQIIIIFCVSFFFNICKRYPMEPALAADKFLFITQTTTMWFQEQESLKKERNCWIYHVVIAIKTVNILYKPNFSCYLKSLLNVLN